MEETSTTFCGKGGGEPPVSRLLRGANPIYAEHGVMDYRALGKEYGADHPPGAALLRRAPSGCGICRRSSPAQGASQSGYRRGTGRLDGFVGMGQTHLWGQREKDEYRIGNAERSWELFERFYRRRSWENRERFGKWTTGNPPLGQVDVLPYDAPVELLSNYRALSFLGGETAWMTAFTRGWWTMCGRGQLLMTAAHMDSAVSPQGAFKPYLDGDWASCSGVRMRNGEASKPVYGVKFREEPACGWRFPSGLPTATPNLQMEAFGCLPGEGGRFGACSCLRPFCRRQLERGDAGRTLL